jgi:uncharacterized membrane protein
MKRRWTPTLVIAGLALAGVDAIADSTPKSMKGCLYPQGSAFVETYCADCHTKPGASPSQKRAYAVLQLDTYDQWKASSKVILAVVNKWHLDGSIMPPASASPQPPDTERHMIVDWLTRGSPNTPSGQ